MSVSVKTKKDAKEYGLLEKQDGARTALLAARNVSLKPGKEKGDKVSATEFAAEAGRDVGTVRHNHKAWDRFAEANVEAKRPDGTPVLPLAKDLVPGQEVEFDSAKLPFPWRSKTEDGRWVSNFPTASAGGDHRVRDEDGNQDPEKAEKYAEEAAKAKTTKGMAIRVGSNKAALAAAIKADPEVAKAAHKALVEKNADAISKAAQKAQFEAVEAGFPPMAASEDDADGELVQADYAVAEAKRRDWVWGLEADAKALYEKLQAGIEEFGHTGVSDEIETLQSAVHYATEFAFGVNDFVVTTTSKESTS